MECSMPLRRFLIRTPVIGCCSVAKRRERNILRRLVASNLYSSGRIAEPVSWKPTKEEEFIEESYPSQLAGMVDSLKEAYELDSFGRLTVVDGGAEFNEAFSESLYNPVERTSIHGIGASSSRVSERKS